MRTWPVSVPTIARADDQRCQCRGSLEELGMMPARDGGARWSAGDGCEHSIVRIYVLMIVRGLSFAALLWTTKALPAAVVLSFRARCTRSAGIITASPASI